MDTCLAMATIQASGVVLEKILRADGFHVQLAEQKERSGSRSPGSVSVSNLRDRRPLLVTQEEQQPISQGHGAPASTANICLLLTQYPACYFLTGAWGSKA